MATENYINLYFTDEQIRIKVLTNICRMLITRGYMDIEKYKKKTENEKVIIDESLFLPFIGSRIDNNIYIIPLDKPYIDQRESKEPLEFDNKNIIVKLIYQVVKDVSNSPLLNDFFKTYNKNHSIIVFDGMATKVYMTLSRKKNIEIYDRDSLMIDIMSHVCSPISCSLVSENDISYITNLRISKIYENDPLCKYYNGKPPAILRIERPSINNGIEIAYRRIIDQKAVFVNKK